MTQFRLHAINDTFDSEDVFTGIWHFSLPQTCWNRCLNGFWVVHVQVGQRLQISDDHVGCCWQPILNLINKPVLVKVRCFQLRIDILSDRHYLGSATRLIAVIDHTPKLGMCWVELLGVVRQVVSKLRNNRSAWLFRIRNRLVEFSAHKQRSSRFAECGICLLNLRKTVRKLEISLLIVSTGKRSRGNPIEVGIGLMNYLTHLLV